MKLFRKAILVIHGFAGGVYDQEYLVHRLELISNFDVFTFTLPGHDGDTTDKITREKWINACDKEIQFLIKAGYNEIYVIGHSMGGVLASYVASKYKEVKKLVLVAPAFRIFGYENGFIDLDSALKKAPKIFENYGANVLANRVFKLPINCFVEFMKLINEYQDIIKNVNVPTLIIRGLDDAVVPEESVIHVYQNLHTNIKRIYHLKNTTHDVFRDSGKKLATKAILNFLKNTNSIVLLEDEK